MLQVITADEPIDYWYAHKQMQLWVDERQCICWLLEHPAIVVTGDQVGRGGGAIYHGPGQRIIYFAIPLSQLADDIIQLVASLELILATTCLELGITVQTRVNGPGIWLNNSKVGFIGLRISRPEQLHTTESRLGHERYVSHGIAVNLNVDLSQFEHINICNNLDTSVGNLHLDRIIFDQVFIKHLQQLLRHR